MFGEISMRTHQRPPLENISYIVYDNPMRELTAKLILLCYCMFSLLFVPLNAGLVTGLFLVVAASCLMYVLADKKWLRLIAGIYLLLSIPFPTFCIFYPVLLYDPMRKKMWWLGGLSATLLLPLTLPEHLSLCFFIIFGIVISGFISSLTQTLKSTEDILIRTQDDSKEKNLLLSEKNRHLIERQNQEIYTATLKERNRIAREIHDNVGHMLSRSILMVGALKAINQQEILTDSLIQLEDTLNQAMNNVRESVHDLHDDSVDLRASIEEIIAGFTKCKCELDYDMGQLVPNAIKYSMISIVKEALANVIRHSNATLVTIRMREHPGLYQLIIDDNGDTDQLNTAELTDHTTPHAEYGPSSISRSNSESTTQYSASNGMGLINMKDRIHSLRGNIQFQSNHGFHIFITIPKGEQI